jgi:Bacterial Ig-like domain (group 3)/Ricin-type beta-trefoil lectin domain-like
LNPGATVNVLDTQGSTVQGAPVTQVAAATGTASQEWNIVTAGNGYFTVVNKTSGMVLATVAGTSAADALQQQAPASVNADWITPAAKNQTWQIVPVHISIASTATTLAFASATLPSVNPGGNPGTVNVSVEDAGGAIIGAPAVPVTLTITGPGSFSQTANATSTNGVASFSLSNVVLNTLGSYTFSATSAGLTTATTTLTVKALPGTTTGLTPSATNVLTGASVTFTSTVTGTTGIPAPTGMVAFLDGTTQLGSVMLSSNVATYATAALAVGTHSITANYLGDANNASSVSPAVQVVVSPPPGFAVSLSPSSASIAPGSSATTAVSITPSGGFSASTSFACSGLPTATTCSFSPAMLTPSGAVATTTLTIATNVSTASLDIARPNPGVGGHQRGTVSDSLAVVLAMFAMPCLFRVKRRKWFSMLAVFFLTIGLCLVSGCGSSATPSPTPVPVAPVTPAGQSTVTITATSGSLTNTAAFQLTIQ